MMVTISCRSEYLYYGQSTKGFALKNLLKINTSLNNELVVPVEMEFGNFWLT